MINIWSWNLVLSYLKGFMIKITLCRSKWSVMSIKITDVRINSFPGWWLSSSSWCPFVPEGHWALNVFFFHSGRDTGLKSTVLTLQNNITFRQWGTSVFNMCFWMLEWQVSQKIKISVLKLIYISRINTQVLIDSFSTTLAYMVN